MTSPLLKEYMIFLKQIMKFMGTEFSNKTMKHRRELSGNNPIFTVVMVIYHYVERIRKIFVPSNFCIKYRTMKKNYVRKPVHIHIQSLINIIQEKNWVVTTKTWVRENYQYFVVLENG